MTDKHEEVVELLRSRGPSLSVELSEKIGLNSFVMSAVLSELKSDGRLRSTHRRIGSSLLFFIPGMEDRARERLFTDLSIQEKKILERIKKSRLVLENNLEPHEKFFINNLADFVNQFNNDGKKGYAYYTVNNEEIDKLVKGVKVPVSEKPKQVALEPEPRLFEKQEPKEPELATGYESKAVNYLKALGEIIERKTIRKNTETDFVVKFKSQIGEQLFFVKFKKKAKLNESDLSLTYAECLKRKMPGIILTNGSLTKSSEKFKNDNAGELIRIVKIK